MSVCKSTQCLNNISPNEDFCPECLDLQTAPEKKSMSELYPKYYKDVSALDEVDVYAVHHLFDLQDASGALHHASKKLLLSGVRTGGKTKEKDIREARDTLTRWLQLHGHE